eukprot:155452_1
MSAAEIITVMKAINDHVTNKYCDAIVGYLNEKTNAHLLFERQFFNSMDQSVQKLVNEITGALKPTSSSVGPISSVSKNILSKIQKHCNKYNQKKKNMYDNHLVKIKQFEQKCINIIQQMLKEKVTVQNNLFDAATANPSAQQNMDQDIITTLLGVGKNTNTQNNATNSANQTSQAPNTHNMSITNNKYATNMQNTLNSLFHTQKSKQLSPTPIQTSSISNPLTNNINEVNQINQFLSFLSNPINASGGNDIDNIFNDNITTSTISAHNAINSIVAENNINMNGCSQPQNNNNNKSIINNNMNNTKKKKKIHRK